ncbi:DUF1016 N-terminal domain-containing protein [Mongoliibacter ruber]|uniref:Uncharacterized protein DUF1016 n=1 Tax=Mongoliibacter ruber TaxID=1750599 RepID=A0A2T0WK46_9BACT|nr:DUF1016 N-terminal domain-containing protein [Mongoliibacter ruber]PRY87081.1 uncharacterized protein DUF1016 [Mongoliibacter ruber]
MKKDYSIFLGEIKSHILQSRYKAAAAVNRELILLYFQIGTQPSQKIKQAKWGSRVIQQLAEDLQKEINGLHGFFYTNLKNMRQFADEYSNLRYSIENLNQNLIGQLATGQLPAQSTDEFLQLATAQFENTEYFLSRIFFNISFTQQ